MHFHSNVKLFKIRALSNVNFYWETEPETRKRLTQKRRMLCDTSETCNRRIRSFVEREEYLLDKVILTFHMWW